MGEEWSAKVHEVFSDAGLKLAIVVLFGKPGRGKTFLCSKLCESSAYAQEINASSERKGEDLRNAFERFMRSASMVHDGVVSLFMDEADGLGEIGQLTTASFLSELSGSCKARNVRLRVMFACNDISLMHSSILSRAQVVAEVPRPTREQLVAAGRAWVHEQVGLSAITSESLDALLDEASRFAGGDYRTMLQGILVSSASSASSGGSSSSSLICPKDFAKLMLAPEFALDSILDFLRESWEKGYRDDVVQVWVDQILTVATSHERRLLLITISRKLRHITPITLLQVYGVFVRECSRKL